MVGLFFRVRTRQDKGNNVINMPVYVRSYWRCRDLPGPKVKLTSMDRSGLAWTIGDAFGMGAAPSTFGPNELFLCFAGPTFSTGRAGPSRSLGGELGGLAAGYDLWSANVRAN